MSVSDPRYAKSFADEEARDGAHPLDGLAARLSATPSTGSSPRRDLEHLVSMLAKRNIQTDDRLTNALEGLARWSDRPEPAAATGEIEPDLRAAPLDAAPKTPAPLSAAEERMHALARSLAEPAVETKPIAAAQPVASLRAALAQIAARQKDLDDVATAPAEPASPLQQRPSVQIAPPAPVVEPAVVAELRREIDRLNRAVVDLPTRSDVDGLLKEIGALAVRSEEERPLRLDADTMHAIEALVVEVERMRSDAVSPARVERLAVELSSLSAKLDTTEPQSFEALNALAERVDDVRAELAQFPPVGVVETLASEIQNLVARLDGQERAAEKRAAEARASEAAMRAEFARDSSTLAMDEVSRKLDVLADHLETQSAASGVYALPGKMDTLNGKLDALAAATLTRQGDVERVADVVRAELAAFSRPDSGIADIGDKIEALTLQLSRRPKGMEGFDALVAKVDGLDEKLASRQEHGAAFDRIEEAVRGIAEHLVVTSSGPDAAPGAMSAVEVRIASLVDSLERTDGRIDDLNAGFASLASRIEQSCSGLGAEAGRAAATAVRESFVEQGSAEVISPSFLAEALGEIRTAASRNDRRTADTLDAVRLTLERMADRMDAFASPRDRQHDDAPSIYAERSMTAPAPVVDATEAARAAARRAIAEIESDEPAALFGKGRRQSATVTAEPDLASDMPLEPGAAPRAHSFGEPEAAPAQSAASFIAAARRATVQPTAELDEFAPQKTAKRPRIGSPLAALKARRLPLLLALAAALIVLGVYSYTSSLNNQVVEMTPEPAPQTDMKAAPYRVAPSIDRPATETPVEPEMAPAHRSDEPSPPPPVANEPPAATPPTPKPGAMLVPPRAPAADMTDFAFAQSLSSPAQKFGTPGKDDLTTGSISRDSDGLPDSIGGSMLRMRAVQGDPSAQLEIADRLAEGRGVPADPAAATRWLEKAAAQGLAPAQHRLGSMYEKGRGVPRDIVTARRWYEQAAASGNVRAMHNLGVIHAEGGLGKPDFNAAMVWFRMAAERGLVDSQYNLAVLEARGLGGKRDLADAYKWFALANIQGDQDAGRKRDEVAKALGGGLPSAKQSVQNFRPRLVDSSANEAPTPPGGWDQASIRADPKTPAALR